MKFVEGNYAVACAAFEAMPNAAIVLAPGGLFRAVELASKPDCVLSHADSLRRPPYLFGGALYSASSGAVVVHKDRILRLSAAAQEPALVALAAAPFDEADDLA